MNPIGDRQWLRQADLRGSHWNTPAASSSTPPKIVAEKPEDFPGNFELHFDLAFAYTQLEQDEKAIEHYRKAVEKKPDLIPARLNLAMVLLRRQRPAEAVPHLKAAIEARPDDDGL